MEDPGGYQQLILQASFMPIGSINWAGGISLTLILLILSGIISGSEVAFFSLKPGNLDHIKTSTIKDALVKLLDHPKSLLATILIMNNMVNIGVVVVTDDMVKSIDFDEMPEWLQFGIQVVAVTFLILMFGEVVPKVYASKNTVRISILMAYPMMIAVKIFKPLSFPLTSLTGFIDKKLKRKEANFSVTELSHALDLTNLGEHEKDNHKILKGIVEFGNIEVSAIMTPRVDVISTNIDMNYKDLLLFIRQHGYSRIPIFKESFDQIEGVLYIKDLLPFLTENENYNWSIHLRKPFFVPENKKIDDLLKEFQLKKMHMAIVADEYGGSSGIVTLEDIIEEIVGEINDEYDEDIQDFYKVNEHTFIMEGKTPINDILRGLNLPEDFFDEVNIDSDTIAGIILEINGSLPVRKDIISYKNLKFEILSSDNRKINKLKVTMNPTENSENSKNNKGGKIAGLLLLTFLFLLSACSEKPITPKPKGYPYIEFPKKEYIIYDSDCPFTFEYPKYSVIEPYTGDQSKNCWFNLKFPSFKASLYLTYENAENGKVSKLLEDSRDLAYKHAVKASGIEETLLESREDKVYGIIYNIEGDVASSYHFHVTDSVHHFLMGSLYFEMKANSDSVAPVAEFLKKDVIRLAETLKWKN